MKIRSIVSRITHPQRTVKLQEMHIDDLNGTLHGLQGYLNSMATNHRISFAFTEIPCNKGCTISCIKGSNIISSECITVADSHEVAQSKVAKAVNLLVNI